MTKATLVMALAATLVLSTVTLATTAYAVEEGDRLEIEARGPIICILPDIGEQKCGQSKARFNLNVNTINEDGSYSGNAQGQIALKGTAIINPAGVLRIIADEPLQYTYDAAGRLLISGNMVDSNGNTWSLDGEGSYNLKPNGKSKIDIVLNVGGQEGEEFRIPVQGILQSCPVG